MSSVIKYTQEEIAWIKENYPCDESQEDTYNRFCEKFGNVHGFHGFVTYAKSHGIHKPVYRQKYQKGNRTWSTGLSKEEHMKHFSKQSYASMCLSASTTPHQRRRIEWEKEHGPIPKGYVLSDLGNGEFMLMERKIHKCMRYCKALGKGELTKAMYETYVAKKEIEKLTGKIVRRKTERQSKEYLETIRPKRTPKLTDETIEEIKNKRKDGVSAIKLAEIYGVSRKTINNYLRRENNYI